MNLMKELMVLDILGHPVFCDFYTNGQPYLSVIYVTETGIEI